ncbi:MAG TPA: hypothetical protein VII63_04620 [Caulobacteraceae bacterium]
MTHVARLDAFTNAFSVIVVDGEILISSDQAAVELAFTAESAADTAQRLMAAAEQVRRERAAKEA